MESLFHSAISESEALEPQIKKLREAARNRDSLGFGLSDKVLAFVIVMALPESMSTMKTILYNTTGAALTSDNIIAQILNDEQWRIRSSGLEVTVFYSKASAAGKKQRKKCTHCNIRGHDVSECRKLKAKRDAKTSSRGKKPKALPAPSSAKVAKAGSDSDASNTDGPTIYHASITKQGLIATEHALTSRDIQGHWIVDSRASRTMCSHHDWFHSFEVFKSPTHVILGDNSTIPATRSGRVHVHFPAKGKWHCAILENVLYIPELHGNLLSVHQLAKCGARLLFEHTACQILGGSNDVLAEGKSHGSLYTMTADVIKPPTALVALLDAFPSEGENMPDSALSAKTSSAADLITWHRRLAHLNANSVLQMVSKGMVKGMEINGRHPLPDPCEPCVKGKQTRDDIRKSTDNCSPAVLGRVFSDVCGKLPMRSHQGFEYFITWTDDKSRKVNVAGLKAKSDVFKHLKQYITQVELETGEKLKILRTDGGGAYTGTEVNEYLKDKGCHRRDFRLVKLSRLYCLP